MEIFETEKHLVHWEDNLHYLTIENVEEDDDGEYSAIIMGTG